MAFTETFRCEVCGKAMSEESDWWLAWVEQFTPLPDAAAPLYAMGHVAFASGGSSPPVWCSLRSNPHEPLDDQQRRCLSRVRPASATLCQLIGLNWSP